jgi:hypothetical protein
MTGVRFNHQVNLFLRLRSVTPANRCTRLDPGRPDAMAHLAVAKVCAQDCAQTRSEARHPSANANHEPNKKNGPEIVNFRPVPRFLAALANRRLQPLGHLTAEL